MTRKSKKLYLLSAILFLLCILSASFGFTFSLSAKADNNQKYFSVEEYTDNDYLLKANGEASYRTIKEFAKEVRGAKNQTSFPELAEVIPLNYLESTETNAVFKYNGRA